MKDEKKPRRQDLIVTTVCGLGLATTIYVAKPSEHKGHTGARDACIQQASSDSASRGVQRLVLDRNDSYVKRDEASILKGATRVGINPVPFDFGHMNRHEEPMLWVPDVLGWCYARGGVWRHRVRDHVHVVTLQTAQDPSTTGVRPGLGSTSSAVAARQPKNTPRPGRPHAEAARDIEPDVHEHATEFPCTAAGLARGASMGP